MKTKEIQTGSKQKSRFFLITTLILLFISFLWLLYDIYAYQQIKTRVPELEIIGKGVFTGFIPQILLYISFFILMISSLRYIPRFKLTGIVSILLGVVSAISMVSDFSALTDIGHDYVTERYACTLEWTFLYIGTCIHFLFYISGFMALYKLILTNKSVSEKKDAAINEILFEIIQYVGIVCGLGGVFVLLYAYIAIGDRILTQYLWLIWLISAYCIAIIIPYITAVFIWMIRLTKRNNGTKWDEKQKYDLSVAGLITWVISIPLMLVLFLFYLKNLSLAATILWFPFYIFSTLFIFSFTALYKFKKG